VSAYAYNDNGNSSYVKADGITLASRSSFASEFKTYVDLYPSNIELGYKIIWSIAHPYIGIAVVADSVSILDVHEWNAQNVQDPTNSLDHNPIPLVLRIKPGWNKTGQPQTGAVKGYVTDSATEDPIKGAEVCVNGYCNKTDEDGYYLIEGIPIGKCQICANAEDYEEDCKSIEITAGATLQKDFQLVVAELPDLTFSYEGLYSPDGIYISPEEVVPGEFVYINVMVRNIGGGVAKEDFYVNFYLGNPDKDKNGVIDPDAKQIGQKIVEGPFPAGVGPSVWIDWTPSGVPPYDIYVVIDPEVDTTDSKIGSVLESDEDNNKAHTVIVTDTPTSNIALILAPHAWHYNGYTENLAAILRQHGWEAIVWQNIEIGNNSQVNVPSFFGLLEENIIGLIHYAGHGPEKVDCLHLEAYNNRKEAMDRYIELAKYYPGVGFMEWEKAGKKAGIWTICITGKALTERFKSHTLGNAFVYLEGCYYGKHKDLCNAFTKIGAGAVLGFTDYVYGYADLGESPGARTVTDYSEEFYNHLFEDKTTVGQANQITKPPCAHYILPLWCVRDSIPRIYGDENLKLVSPENAKILTIVANSPVDLIISDPNGNVYDKNSDEYHEVDLDADGDLEDIIIIKNRNLGLYKITIIPESDAGTSERYSLEAASPGSPVITLAENVPISDIPAQPYIIESTEEGIFRKIPGDLDNDADIDQDDLNILLTHRNQPASVCPECDIDGDGVITVLDARKLVLLCTRPRCATE